MNRRVRSASCGRKAGLGLWPASDPQEAGQSHLVMGSHRRVVASGDNKQATRHDRRDVGRHDHGYRRDIDRGQP